MQLMYRRYAAPKALSQYFCTLVQLTYDAYILANSVASDIFENGRIGCQVTVHILCVLVTPVPEPINAVERRQIYNAAHKRTRCKSMEIGLAITGFVVIHCISLPHDNCGSRMDSCSSIIYIQRGKRLDDRSEQLVFSAIKSPLIKLSGNC